MEFVILGLLALKPRTIYEINKALERGLSLFYSASFGSINAAIARMLEKSWIAGEQLLENGRNKNVFHLTPAGYEAFQDWLVSEIESERVKDPALTRLFFMGFSSPEERVHVLETNIQKIRLVLQTLDGIHQQAIEAGPDPSLEEVRRFQMLTLDYGRAFFTFNITWYENLLVRLKTELL